MVKQTFLISSFLCFFLSATSTFGQEVEYVDSLLQVIQNTSSSTEKAINFNELAYHFHMSDSTLALGYAEQAIQQSKTVNDKNELATAYKYKGLTHGYFGNNQRAINAYDTAYTIFEKLKDTSQMIKVLNNVGRQYSNVGEYEKAIQGYLQAEQWMTVQTDSLLWMILKFNHTVCLSESMQYRSSIAICDEILPIAKSLNNWHLQTELNSLKGINYGYLKKYQAAEIAYGKAFDAIPKATLPTVGSGYVSSNPDLESNILNNRAMLFIEQKQFEKAYSDLQLAIAIWESANSSHPNGEFYVNMGIAAKGMNRWAESTRYFEEGLRRLKQTNQTPFVGETYGFMAELYEVSGQGMLAYDYLKKSHEIQDSLLSERTKKNLQELNVKYETEKFRNDLAASQLQIQTQRYHFNLLIIGIGSLFLLSVLGYFYYNAKQQRRLLALEKQQIELQYGLLRAQMNPHFIFNALNSIHGFFANHQFVRGNEFMGKFSQLIRQILDQSVLKVHPLSAELDTLRLYLDIEKERMDGNLDYTIQLATNVEEDMIELPPLIFQPFVENAIWHGIAPKDTKGHIWIDINLDDSTDKLFCQIKDDGVGLQKNKMQLTNQHTSKGISITRERLGEKGNIEIKNNESHSGVTVNIDISIA